MYYIKHWHHLRWFYLVLTSLDMSACSASSSSSSFLPHSLSSWFPAFSYWSLSSAFLPIEMIWNIWEDTSRFYTNHSVYLHLTMWCTQGFLEPIFHGCWGTTTAWILGTAAPNWILNQTKNIMSPQPPKSLLKNVLISAIREWILQVSDLIA